jgi:adenosylcobinamide-GDP ribazoletransferase
VPPKPSPTTWNDALRLAITTFTVVPLGSGGLDRRAAGRAMSVAPVIGALLGLVIAVAVVGLRESLPPALAGVLGVGLAALLTRGLHLDGTADTVDGLGSYRDRERALEIMKSPEVGPFGTVALIVVVLVQSLSLAALPAAAVVVAFAVGRLAVTLGCVRGVPAARPSGLGAFVAGSVAPAVAVIASVAVTAASVFAVPGRPWQGPLAVAAALLAVLLLRHHVVRRLGGITGDVLGFLLEAATCVAMVGLAMR